MTEAVLFWGFGGAAVIMGLLVITFRNPVHSAMALIVNLLCVAALFAMLDAHFMAAMQVLVYAGAILVLFLFVIMLLNLKPDELEKPLKYLPVGKTLGVLLVGWVIIKLIAQFSGMGGGSFVEVSADYGTIETVGSLIFGRFLLPFEAISVVLLAAVLGSVAIAKRKLW
jgi:NADH-quinone oxidoreductase subunit J